jgi:hypothetical protein
MAGDGKMAKYKDVIELKSDYHRVLTSHLLRDDGTWQQFMTTHDRRNKQAPKAVSISAILVRQSSREGLQLAENVGKRSRSI